MRLDAVRFQDVRIDRALCEKLYAGKLLCFLRKNIDKFRADDFSLLLRIGNARKLIQKAVNGIDVNQLRLQLIAKDGNHLLRLALAQKAVVDMHADELLADGLDEQRRDDRRIHAAGEGKQHLIVSDLRLQRLHLLRNKRIRKCRCCNALHLRGSFLITHVHISPFVPVRPLAVYGVSGNAAAGYPDILT